MNPASQKEAEELFEGIKKTAKEFGAVICPPFVYLSLLKGATLGAQDVFLKKKVRSPEKFHRLCSRI